MDKKLWEIKCYIKVNEKIPQNFCFKMKWCSFNEIPLWLGCCLRGHLPMCTAHARFQNGAYSRHHCAEWLARQRDADIKWLLCQSLTAPDGQAVWIWTSPFSPSTPAARPLGFLFFWGCFLWSSLFFFFFTLIQCASFSSFLPSTYFPLSLLFLSVLISLWHQLLFQMLPGIFCLDTLL